MRITFATTVLKSLKEKKLLTEDTRILAVCAGGSERELFIKNGLLNVLLAGLDPLITTDAMMPLKGVKADTMALPFADKEFEFVFVSDGLHHCDSPHRALLEMYRVASKGVIVLESRDNLVQRIAERLCWPRQTYELAAVEGNGGICGGVNYTSVPNYVYRWTEREFEKTISCVDPTGRPSFKYFYGFNPPNRKYKGFKKALLIIANRTAAVLAQIFKRQSNSFCMVALKSQTLFPWLEHREGRVEFRA